MSRKHWCPTCKGRGIEKTELRLVHGKKRPYTFRVACPGELADKMGTQNIPMAGQDRAAGEAKETENG